MPLVQDKVHLAATRPATWWGTHYAAVIGNMIFTLYAATLLDNLWMFALAPVIHGICVLITSYDPHAFRLLALKGRHGSETLGNRFFWKASARSAFPRRLF